MASQTEKDAGPDLTKGISLSDFGDRLLLRGHVGDQAVVLARIGAEVMAVGATCTHYGGPLAKGLIVGDTVRCPWHHACFSLRSGEALGAPAFDPLPCWKVERVGDRIVVRERIATEPKAGPPPTAARQPESVVIVGGGAAGFACAEMLRRRGYHGPLTILSDDSTGPCDRPNLSKGYLAGTAREDWIPLQPDEFYEEKRINLLLGASVKSISATERTVMTEDGRIFPFDRLLLATGAEPIRPPIPGRDRDHVFTLRSLADSRAIIERAKSAKVAVVLGSGFIGLETAAALRSRGLEVHVVSLEARPLESVLGPELGDFIRHLHEERGVIFHMGDSLAQIGPGTVTLSSGHELAADLVIFGVGVRPRTALAEAAGIAVDRGILVDEHLETGVPGVFAAGDVARWRDAMSGRMQRIEHWVVAERHGQVVAENMLGARTVYRDAPFFWSAHYEVMIRYAGYAESWDTIDIDGSVAARNCIVAYKKDGRTVAMATIGRDLQALEYAASMEPAGS